MAKKATDNSTPISSQVGTRPAVIPTLSSEPLRQLVRIVAALPLHEFMPLTDAFFQAEKLLGSRELAASDLTNHARARRLTVAARWVERSGIEQAGILRSAFWQYYKISLSVPFNRLEPPVVVRGPPTAGPCHFFVGRRRFDRLYSTAAPSKPVEVERKRNPTKQAVWEHMNNNPTERDKPGYAHDLWTKKFKREGKSQKTIQNYVSQCRSENDFVQKPKTS